MPKKFLNVREVARLMGVTPLTVRNWDQKGKLSAYRNPVNNYRLYKVEDVEILIDLLRLNLTIYAYAAILLKDRVVHLW